MKKNDKIVIFGGSGFIGRNLYLYLIREYQNVYIFDKNKPKKIKYKKKYFIHGNILNSKQILNCLKNVDIVIHLAAHGGVLKSLKEPKENLKNNVLGTLNILESVRINKVKKIIFASSGGTVIGDTKKKLKEDSLPNPMSHFGVSKLASEKYCNVYSNLYGFISINLRFSNVYGPFSENKSNFINNLIKSSISDTKIIINGDGTQSRDFIHVDDIVHAISKAIKFNRSNTFQIGTGVKTGLNKIIKYIIKFNSNYTKKNIINKSKIKGEVQSVISNTSKSKNILRFKYKIKLQDGLKSTYEWFEKNEL
tara:strand:+ start:313 stop:1236 length:924 start_codon:yes stop_codon:yes gene_type:complete